MSLRPDQVALLWTQQTELSWSNLQYPWAIYMNELGYWVHQNKHHKGEYYKLQWPFRTLFDAQKSIGVGLQKYQCVKIHDKKHKVYTLKCDISGIIEVKERIEWFT